jgi:3-phenylpropionate/cinnamic acid dioxygenase small subunit
MNRASKDIDMLPEVSDLINREAKYLDQRRWDDWLNLYSDDAVFWAPSWSNEDTLIEDPKTSLNMVFLEGRGRLEDRVFRIETEDSYASMPLDRTVHVVGNITVDGTNNEAIHASANAIVHSYGRHGAQTTGRSYEYVLSDLEGRLTIKQKKIILIDDAVAGPIDIYHF